MKNLETPIKFTPFKEYMEELKRRILQDKQ